MDINDIVIGKRYTWLMPNDPRTQRKLRYLLGIAVTVESKTTSRVRVRFEYRGKVYTRTISTVNLLDE